MTKPSSFQEIKIKFKNLKRLYFQFMKSFFSIMSILKVDVYSDFACPWCFIGKRHFDSVFSINY